MKLLLNYDHVEKKDETEAERPALKKKLSRRVFAITAPSVVGEDDEDQNDDSFGDEDEDADEDDDDDDNMDVDDNDEDFGEDNDG